MPEHLRDLAVILILASLVYHFASRPALAIINPVDLGRRRSVWLLLTIASFLISNFWVFALIAVAALSFVAQRDSSRVGLFFSMLFVMPAASTQVPGFGVINYLFALDYLRLLTLAVLLPVWFRLSLRSDTLALGRTWPDKFLIAFVMVAAALQLRETSFTDAMRYLFNLFVDILLPYFVVSRSLRTLHDFKEAMLAFVLAAMVLALVAVAETMFFHLFYRPPLVRMGLDWNFMNYLPRDSMLRASGSTGHPIALGYVMVMAIGFFVFIRQSIANPRIRLWGMVLLLAGLIAPFSRGPWIGGVVFLVVYVLLGPNPIRRLAKIGMSVLVAIPLLFVLPGGHFVVNLLPFIGTTETVNVLHRENLLDAAYVVVMRNPLFGSVNYGAYPEIQDLLLGGIIDIVNTYVLYALEIGLVGVGLFVSVFLLIGLSIYKSMRSLPSGANEERLLGRVLLAALLATMVTIFTTSSITVIPIVYWSLMGMGLAYSLFVHSWVLAAASSEAADALPEENFEPIDQMLPANAAVCLQTTSGLRGNLAEMERARRERAHFS